MSIMQYHAVVFPFLSGLVEIGDFKVELATLLAGGLSHRAYGSIDIQSDSDCCKKLNPGFLGGLFCHVLLVDVESPDTR